MNSGSTPSSLTWHYLSLLVEQVLSHWYLLDIFSLVNVVDHIHNQRYVWKTQLTHLKRIESHIMSSITMPLLLFHVSYHHMTHWNSNSLMLSQLRKYFVTASQSLPFKAAHFFASDEANNGEEWQVGRWTRSPPQQTSSLLTTFDPVSRLATHGQWGTRGLKAGSTP